MTSVFLVVALLTALVTSSQGALPEGAAAVSLTVENYGKLNGYEINTQGTDIECYLGIPFAQPPTGARRFRPPEPLPAPDNRQTIEYDATMLPTTCYQSIDTAFEASLVNTWNPNTNMSEDCLYLNVWTPSGATNKPVMVWIFGGGFVSGSATLALYDGKVLAAKGDVVVASMQYRIGPLGFLYDGTEAAPGNAGLLDQQLALEWINKNIAAFGGDPAQVTIFGESAGAASVGYHLLSEGSDAFFRAAMMESATPIAPWAFVEQDVAKQRALKLAELVGCPQDNATGCMLGVSPQLLSDQQWSVRPVTITSFNFVPTLDNNFIKKSPKELVKAGEFQRKNIVAGINSHEGAFFVLYSFVSRFSPILSYTDDITSEDYPEMVKDLMLVNTSSDAVTDTIAAMYALPCGAEGNTYDDDAIPYFRSLDGVLGDNWFKCPVIGFAKAYAKQNAAGGGKKVYMYAFNHRTSANGWPSWTGDALHGYEIDHVFGVPFTDTTTYSDAERTLSGQMITYWTNFVKTGNPNGDSVQPGTTEWPEYTYEGRRVIVFENTTQVTTQTGLRDRYCDFWWYLVPELVAATATGRASVICGSMSLLILSAVLTLIRAAIL